MTSNDDPGCWRDRAACRHADPEVFFPVGSCGPAAAREIEQARKICAGCPVRTACLDWALAHGAAFGIWGGLTEHERRAVRAREQPAAYTADDSQEGCGRWMTG